jgi:hypothetical protein
MASKEPAFAFALDEKVLCFHGPQVYEAKVGLAHALLNVPDQGAHRGR